jgi:hypothetical protein
MVGEDITKVKDGERDTTKERVAVKTRENTTAKDGERDTIRERVAVKTTTVKMTTLKVETIAKVRC